MKIENSNEEILIKINSYFDMRWLKHRIFCILSDFSIEN